MSRIVILLAILAIFSPLSASQPGIRKPALCSLTKGLTKTSCGKLGNPVAVNNFCAELLLPKNLTSDPANAKLSRFGCGLVNQDQLQAAISSAISGISRSNSSQQGDTFVNVTVTQLLDNLTGIATAQTTLELLVKELSASLSKVTTDLATLTAAEKADIASLNATLAQLVSSLSGLNGTGDLTQILQTISQLNSTVSVLNATIFGALPPGSEVANAIAALNKTAGELSAAITALAAKEAADVAKLTSALGALTATVNGITGGGPLNISLTDIISQLQQLSSALTTLQQAVGGANSTTLSALSSTVSQLTAKLTALQNLEASDVAAINSAIASLNSTIQSIQQKQTQQDGQLVNLGATTVTLNSTLATVQTTLTSLTNAISGLTGLSGNLNGILGTLNSLNSTIQTLNGGLTTVTNNQTSIATDLLGLGQTVTSLTNTVNGLTGLGVPVLGTFDAGSLSSLNPTALTGTLGLVDILGLGGSLPAFSSASMTVQSMPTVANPDQVLMTLRMTALKQLTFGLGSVSSVLPLGTGTFLNRNNGNLPLTAFTVPGAGANGLECPFSGDIVGRITSAGGLQFLSKGLLASLLSVLSGTEFVCQFLATYTGTI